MLRGIRRFVDFKNGGIVSSRILTIATSRSHHKIVPVDDLPAPSGVRNEDDVSRCKLAAAYRLVELKKWSWSIYNHITIRSAANPDHFFVNPYGLLYSEVTAGSLLKIDSKCNVVEQGSTTYGLNKAGFVLHSTIHEARRDINAVLHVHTGVAAGISTLKCGLLPISQEAMLCGRVGYHDYSGILVDDAMRAQITKDLGERYKIVVLRNHGVVFCGSTIEEAWFWLMTFMTAVDIQFHAMAAANGVDNLVVPDKSVLAKVQKMLEMAASTGGINEKSIDGIQWGLGEMELEAEMRQMDALGYKTGYKYKKEPHAIFKE